MNFPFKCESFRLRLVPKTWRMNRIWRWKIAKNYHLVYRGPKKKRRPSTENKRRIYIFVLALLPLISHLTPFLMIIKSKSGRWNRISYLRKITRHRWQLTNKLDEQAKRGSQGKILAKVEMKAEIEMKKMCRLWIFFFWSYRRTCNQRQE